MDSLLKLRGQAMPIPTFEFKVEEVNRADATDVFLNFFLLPAKIEYFAKTNSLALGFLIDNKVYKGDVLLSQLSRTISSATKLKSILQFYCDIFSQGSAQKSFNLSMNTEDLKNTQATIDSLITIMSEIDIVIKNATRDNAKENALYLLTSKKNIDNLLVK